MVYMKRDSGSVVYRAMPLENFMSGMLNQLGFMLNFSDMINDQINGAETTPSTTPQGGEQVKDYGTILSEVLKEFSYSENDGKDVWHLKINGETFSNGILADLAVDISTDENKLVKGLNVTECRIQIPISSTSNLPLDLTLDLTWHNPGGVSDGSDDVTDPNLANVAGNAANGMGGMKSSTNRAGAKSSSSRRRRATSSITAERSRARKRISADRAM